MRMSVQCEVLLLIVELGLYRFETNYKITPRSPMQAE